MKINVTGIDQLEAKLTGIASGLRDLPMAEIAREGATIAARIAPKDTGRLAGSIGTRVGPNTADVTIGVPYARFVLGPQWKRRLDQLMNARVSVEREIDKITQ